MFHNNYSFKIHKTLPLLPILPSLLIFLSYFSTYSFHNFLFKFYTRYFPILLFLNPYPFIKPCVLCSFHLYSSIPYFPCVFFIFLRYLKNLFFFLPANKIILFLIKVIFLQFLSPSFSSFHFLLFPRHFFFSFLIFFPFLRSVSSIFFIF